MTGGTLGWRPLTIVGSARRQVTSPCGVAGSRGPVALRLRTCARCSSSATRPCEQRAEIRPDTVGEIVRPAFEEYFTRGSIKGDDSRILAYDTLPGDDNPKNAPDGCYRLLIPFTIEMDDVFPGPVVLEGETGGEIGP